MLAVSTRMNLGSILKIGGRRILTSKIALITALNVSFKSLILFSLKSWFKFYKVGEHNSLATGFCIATLVATCESDGLRSSTAIILQAFVDLLKFSIYLRVSSSCTI